jgi:outer membrane protein assembly factor BamB
VLADGSMFFVTNDDGFASGGNNASLYYLSSAGAVTFSEPFGEDGFDSCPTLGQDGTLFLADDDGSVSDGSGETSANAFGASAGAVSQIGGLSLPLTNESERFGVVVAADDTSYWGNNGQFFAITPPKAGFGLVAAWPKAGVTLATSGSAVSDLALDNFTNNNLYAYSGWLNGNSVQGNIAALNPATGAQKWIFNMPAAAVSAAIVNSTCPGGDACSAAGNAAPAIALDGTVYVGNGDGLYAINGATGAKLWVSSCGDVTSSPAIGADGTIFFGCGDGILYAVNPNGTLKFKVTTGGPISSSPAIAPDGTVVFISDDGNLYAIN